MTERRARLAVLLVLVALTVTGWVTRSYWMGVFRTETETYVEQTAELADAYDRIAQLEQEAAQEAQELADTSQALRAARDSLRAASAAEGPLRDSLDALVAAQAAATGGWVRIEVHEARLAAERRETLRERARAELAEAHVEILEPLACPGCEEVIRSLWGAIEDLEERDDTQERRVAAALNAGRAGSFGVRLKADWWLAAVGFGVGFLATR